jgi:hypothetical protein
MSRFANTYDYHHLGLDLFMSFDSLVGKHQGVRGEVWYIPTRTIIPVSRKANRPFSTAGFMRLSLLIEVLQSRCMVGKCET